MQKSDGTLLTNLQQYINEIIQKKSNIFVVYVFGSVARAQENDSSDIDLAFCWMKIIIKKTRFMATSSAYLAAAKISGKFDRKTDVVILNSASIEMAYQIITRGVRIYEKDKNERIIKIRGMYFDFMPFIRELRSRCLAEL
ncbi:MAG: nucleotidyltransferase domain-containing protein [Desulfobacteraceae bacterium]|nr:nucleotidyltransferase domain-containing protein [Desulfobacteraceae bacterium]